LPVAACRTTAQDKSLLAVVDMSLCTRCGVCADTCSFSAITMENERPVVHPSACVGCGACEAQCPKNAIALKER